MKKCVCGKEYKNLVVHQRFCKDFLATKEKPIVEEPKVKPEVKDEPKISIYLPREIRINSVKYAGNVTVPIKLARTLLSISSQADHNNVREKTYADHSKQSLNVSVGSDGVKGRLTNV